MSTPSAKHSTAYLNLKQRITESKNGQINVITPLPVNEEQARSLFRQSLHEVVNTEYLHDHGMTEAEAELLHNLIENVESPDA